MQAAKKMVRELKGKEQAINWGIIRNDKKEITKINKRDEIERREYYKVVRKQFIEFLQCRQVEDT
jgi:hypothetical protein